MSAKTNAQRQADRRERLKTEKQVPVNTWIPPELTERLRTKFPGSRGGIDITAALEAAAKKTGD